MQEDEIKHQIRTLQEQGVQCIVGPQGQPLAVLLTLEEYEHYLDLLDDERDNQDPELASRLRKAAAGPDNSERQSLRDYMHEREIPRAQASS